jgi:phosphate transport system substrate-binding protein
MYSVWYMAHLQGVQEKLFQMSRLATVKYIWFLLFTGFLAASACKSYKKQMDEMPDTKERGLIYVSADESFKPVVDEHVQVYESNNPGTKINVVYKPEAECLKDLLIDSIRVIIATRRESKEERDFIADSLRVGLESMVVAWDAIAVITHPRSEVSNFSMQEIKEILTGKFKKNLIPVFDGVKATSTVRFIIDSVLKGDSLTPQAMAARSSEAVVDYVSKNSGVVGFIGVSWIGNPEDTAQMSYLKKVKLAGIQHNSISTWYVKPSQATIYMRDYPMVRDLVYILKERHNGLAHGFVNFMSGELGQLIFKRAYLAPAKKNFGIRPVRLRE